MGAKSKDAEITRYARAMGLTNEEAESRIRVQMGLFPDPPEPGNPNPMINKYGPDHGGRGCVDCKQLIRLEYHDKAYFKCLIRGVSNGAGTDHRKKWPACRLFEEAKLQEVVDV